MKAGDRGPGTGDRERQNPVLLGVGRAVEWVNLVARGLYSSGLLKVHCAGVPVISVGNIAMGGTGKTPLVAAIALFLQTHGARPAVLTRGYRRRDARPRLIVGESEVPWQEVGDEPALLARMLPQVPIVVDADRVRGAESAVRGARATHLVLDDGFQHWRLARSLDIVTVAAGDPLCVRRLRRESPGALARADVAVAINARPEELAEARPLLCAHAPGLPLLACTLSATGVVLGGTTQPVGWLRGLEVLAFAGIAAPWRFFDTLEELGANVVETRPFPDHHAYSPDDVARLVRRANELGAVPVTTAKDAVKLGTADRDRIASLAIELELPAAAFDAFLLPLLASQRDGARGTTSE